VSDPDALARLLAVANDYELETLNHVRLKAGLIWACTARAGDIDECGMWNEECVLRCEDCGAPKPAAGPEPEDLAARIAALLGLFPGLVDGHPVSAEDVVQTLRDEVAPLYAAARATDRACLA
jgi:hypothetical protein